MKLKYIHSISKHYLLLLFTVKIPVNKPLLSLAAYGSGSEDEDSEQEETVVKSHQSVK